MQNKTPASGTLRGLGKFNLEVINLIANGKKETLKLIEEHMAEGDLIEYLYKKYKNYFFFLFDEPLCDKSTLNAFFQRHDTEGNELKYAALKQEDGLLLILALTANLIIEYDFNWTLE